MGSAHAAALDRYSSDKRHLRADGVFCVSVTEPQPGSGSAKLPRLEPRKVHRAEAGNRHDARIQLREAVTEPSRKHGLRASAHPSTGDQDRNAGNPLSRRLRRRAAFGRLAFVSRGRSASVTNPACRAITSGGEKCVGQRPHESDAPRHQDNKQNIEAGHFGGSALHPKSK
jgi:hypothetical protein